MCWGGQGGGCGRVLWISSHPAALHSCIWAFFLVFEIRGIPGSYVYGNGFTYFIDGAPTLFVGATAFTADDQINILYEAHSGYYLTLITCQCANLFACKTRVVSLWVHGVWANPTTIGAVCLSVCLALM